MQEDNIKNSYYIFKIYYLYEKRYRDKKIICICKYTGESYDRAYFDILLHPIIAMRTINDRYLKFLETFLDHTQIEQFVDACHQSVSKSITLAHYFSHHRKVDFTQKPWWRLEKVRPCQTNHNYYVYREDMSVPLGLTRGHQCGFFYIQESAASLPASLIDYHDHMTILDMCASPGGKTTQILDWSRPYHNITIIANEPDWVRLATLKENLSRMSADRVLYTQYDGTIYGRIAFHSCDCVLLDAPCSGEGTAFKSNNALANWRIQEIKKIANLQYQLLESAYQCCKPGGQIIYSTCTINPLENECNVSRFLDQYPDMELMPIQISTLSTGLKSNTHYTIRSDVSQYTARAWPHIQHTGGFFIAKMKKKVWLSTWFQISHQNPPIYHTNKFTLIGNKLLQSLWKWLAENFGINDLSWYFYSQDQHLIYAHSISPTHPLINLSKWYWLPIIKKLNTDRYLPLHHLAPLYHDQISKNIVNLDGQDIQTYLNGHDLKINNLDDGWYILCHRSVPVMVSKIVSGVLKYKWIKG